MLAPDDRRTLLEALRPPAGYQLDRAIGTTFSLDLQALLLAPLAFTLFGWQDSSNATGADPLALLQAVRSYAERIHIFCQAGQIAIPRPNQLLLAYLERSVFEVVAPDRRGIFHPKVWVLRFTPIQSGAAVSYRLLCLSRNVTFDRSWDTALVVDGQVIDRRYGFSVNNSLAEFMEALPGMAVRPVPNVILDDVTLIQSELRKVDWQKPDGFTALAFYPLGHRGRRSWPFNDGVERRLVVSPFLAPGTLERLSAVGQNHVLISRTQALEAVDPGVLGRFTTLYTLDQALEPEPDDADQAGAAAPYALTGLHAKLYVEEFGQEAHVWTGSANATTAFDHNVEFLARLSGPRVFCGVNAFLDNGRRGRGMMQLLHEFRPPAQAVMLDPVEEKLEKRLQAGRQALVDGMLHGSVKPASGNNLFEIEVQCERTGMTLPARVSVSCWPISLPASDAAPVRLDQDPIARLGPLSLEALTAFLAFELTATEGNRSAAARFVLSVPLSGVPSERDSRLLRSMLQDRNQVLRFLYLLLAEGNADPQAVLEAFGERQGQRGTGGGSGLPLLEAMLRALERNPRKLDAVGRFIEDLRKTPEGRELLPPDLDAVWLPIVAAREAAAAREAVGARAGKVQV